MCEKNQETTCTTGTNYKCYEPGINEKNVQTDFQPYKSENLYSQMYRAKEYGMPSIGFLHPPVVKPPPSLVEPRTVQLPNRFINDLYIKYPFLIPNGIKPEDYHVVGQKLFTSQYDDVTTYQEAYGHISQEPPELLEAKGLSLPEPEKPPVRLPGVPYIPLCRRPLPASYAVDLKARKEEKKESEKILRVLPPLPKRVSEYEANINTLARYWRRNGLYTEPNFYIPHKPTLPRE